MANYYPIGQNRSRGIRLKIKTSRWKKKANIEQIQ